MLQSPIKNIVFKFSSSRNNTTIHRNLGSPQRINEIVYNTLQRIKEECDCSRAFKSDFFGYYLEVSNLHP